jgi:hypothetical protein
VTLSFQYGIFSLLFHLLPPPPHPRLENYVRLPNCRNWEMEGWGERITCYDRKTSVAPSLHLLYTCTSNRKLAFF